MLIGSRAADRAEGAANELRCSIERSESTVMRYQAQDRPLDCGGDLHGIGQPQSSARSCAGGTMRDLCSQINDTPHRWRRERISIIVSYRLVAVAQGAGKDLSQGNCRDDQFVVARFDTLEDRRET